MRHEHSEPGDRPYEQLKAWALAHRLYLEVHRASASWPKREWYGLAVQIRRAAFSVPVNIVEGQAKRGTAEFRRFLDIALGSLAEVQYTLRASHDLGYLPAPKWKELDVLSSEAGRCLWGLARSIQNARRPTEAGG
jgi:four helix bundle protein